MAYIGVQCLGAVAGAGLIVLIMSGMPGWEIADGLGQNGFDSASPAGFNMTAGFIAEIILTFFFVYIILEVTSKKVNKGFEGLAIGFALFLSHIIGIPITGTSVNPARSLGPALWVGDLALEQLWLFWAAPMAGAILAALIWMYLSNPKEMSRNFKM